MRLQFVIIFFDGGDGNFAQMFPGIIIFGNFVLNFGRNFAGFFLGVFVFFATGVGLFVKGRNLVDVVLRDLVKIAVLINNFCQNHSHRSAPVAEVDVRNRFVADKVFYSAERFSDNGRTQMPHMQGFGNVGAAKVKHYRVRIRNFSHAVTFIGGNFIHYFADKGIAQRQVDKTRSVD